jgi:hypothetical protein
VIVVICAWLMWIHGHREARTLTSECLFSCAESLHLSMFCDKKSKMHRSATEFTGWDVLGWEAKLDAARMVLERRFEDRSLSSESAQRLYPCMHVCMHASALFT